ncbi:hypothetical protein B0H66DRAFT_515932 [Apodospora peruviana]|uniref:Galactose oxidase n=1 Tax=Apodospora peruviana TaxID=516989 RepID=A0AAE0I3Y5_9PEZI|nr:hypothetical protein B0H66DRAFT_515932 [Apodospora peruviana]
MAEEVVGHWSDPIELSNVAVHVSLLPTGKVLYWGRRADPKGPINQASLDEHFTRAFVWDPQTGTSTPTANEPLDMNGNPVNLFCAGHCFLPDGKLLIVGGHLTDGKGITHACTYDAATNTFTPKAPMNGGRWYPSALPLPDGRVIVMSGALESYTPNNISQIWSSDTSRPNPWTEVADPRAEGAGVLSLYPRVHLTPKGKIFMAGPQPRSWFLDLDVKKQVNEVEIAGAWIDAKTERQARLRDYCPSVKYDTGKIMYIGGGEQESQGPTEMVEFIDLNGESPQWTSSPSTNMKIPRKQFNATVLPDGSVMVTGGTKGAGFNNLDSSATVHQAELWDPVANKWTDMASENFNRCYHGTALLLPDGRVMSAGSGEYGGITTADCLTNAQFFEPPYLHKSGPRPAIVNTPSDLVYYGEQFSVILGSDDPIDKISWVRLGSVTHCCNMNQSLMFLEGFSQEGTNLTVPAPANANLAPPGHYMLFVLNKQRVPSVGRIMRIASSSSASTSISSSSSSSKLMAVVASKPPAQPHLAEQQERIMAERDRPPVVVGITPVCPYGLGPCWGGAHDALCRMSDIDVVCPVANQADAVALVYLKQEDLLPDIDAWRKEFAQTVNGSYEMRGIETTVSGVLSSKARSGDSEEQMTLTLAAGPQLRLAPFRQHSQLKWDITTRAPRPISDAEAGAYQRLAEALAAMDSAAQGVMPVRVTGTLHKLRDGDSSGKFCLDVRDFKLPGHKAPT